MWVPKNKQEFLAHLNEPLFRNSYYLMANTLLTSSSGFFFWILAARFYTVEEIGLGSALMSAAGLVSILSLFGFDIGLIRYLPDEKDKSGIINSCYTITALIALMLTVVFILGLQILSPALMILQEHTVFSAAFIIFTIIITLFGLQTHVFIASRQAKYSFIQALVSTTLRIVVLPFLVALGAFGVYLSAELAIAIAFIVGNTLIRRVFPVYRPVPTIKKRMINDMIHYSFGNHVANIFYFLPVAVLPLLVINVLGKEMNAYFYVAWMTSAVLLMIPFATSKSLLAESCFSPDDLRRNVIRSFRFVFILLVPAIIGIFIFGRHMLLLFGEVYAKNAFEVLIILSMASIPHAVNVIYATIKMFNKDIMPVIYVYGAVTILTLVGSYMLIQSMGLIGIGISWVFANGVVAAVVWVKMVRNGLFRHRSNISDSPL